MNIFTEFCITVACTLYVFDYILQIVSKVKR